ncbi:MAG: glycosyl transferase family 1 [Prevotellaceae bacterium]|nr:MAG: glycosyl transferase family 1 [Prevotellaceae bacterium]
MKIAMIGHKRVPGREGGVEVVVEELTAQLVHMGHEVTVYNRRCRGVSRQKSFNGARLIWVPTINKKSLDAVVYSFFATLHALFGRYDVIHYHAIGPSVMLFLPHLLGIRTVATVHGLNYKTPKWKGFAAWYIRLGEKIVAKYADEVIVLSRDAQRYFQCAYGRKTCYIPNGVQLRQIRRPVRIKNSWGLEGDDYFLYLSRIVPGKGLEYLVDAYLRLQQPRPKLVIAGDSVHVPAFYQSIREKVEDCPDVIFTGFVQGELMDELYSNARAFVFPSEAEGMPMCLLEAMSYNCLCIVSDIPENKEVMEEHATYFESKNTNALYRALERFLLPAPRPNTRAYAAQRFSWEKIAQKTCSVYAGKEVEDGCCDGADAGL